MSGQGITEGIPSFIPKESGKRGEKLLNDGTKKNLICALQMRGRT